MSVAEDYIQHLDEQHGGDRFAVTDDSKADWACQKITQAQRKMAERAAFVDAEIERIRQWQEDEDARDQRTIDNMTALLRPYFDALRDSGALGKAKNYKLPHGTLQARAAQAKYRRIDDKAFLAWVKERGFPNWVRMKEEVAWSEISGFLFTEQDATPGSPALIPDPETGECVEVPGVVLESPARDVFSVKGAE